MPANTSAKRPARGIALQVATEIGKHRQAVALDLARLLPQRTHLVLDLGGRLERKRRVRDCAIAHRDRTIMTQATASGRRVAAMPRSGGWSVCVSAHLDMVLDDGDVDGAGFIDPRVLAQTYSTDSIAGGDAET